MIHAKEVVWAERWRRDAQGQERFEAAERRRDIHAVKVCQHCSTTWNRDVNAAKNIRAIYEALARGEGRPQAFETRRRTAAAA